MISIVIPTFNRRSFLESAVSSVLNQTFQDWELIVVDDGSIDGTRHLTASWADSRIRTLHCSHRGVSAARNTGIRQARGPWIALLDSDDKWLPLKLQRQIEALEEEPELRIVHSDEIWIRRGRRVNQKKIHQKHGGWIYRHCLPRCAISPSSILLHRNVLADTGLFDETFPVCEDYELWLRMTARFPVLYLDEKLVVKEGGHPDQLSRSRWGLDRFRLLALMQSLFSGRLTLQQKTWTCGEIVKKARILETGFRNNGRIQPAILSAKIAEFWESGIPDASDRPPPLLEEWRNSLCGDAPSRRPDAL